MTNLESKILARELGKLGGIGAKWAAHFLPNVADERTFVVNAPLAIVGQRIENFLRDCGKPISEVPSNPERGTYVAVVGSGRLNINPTILYLDVQEMNGESTVHARAIAKEGAVKQRTAQILLERLEAVLTGQ